MWVEYMVVKIGHYPSMKVSFIFTNGCNIYLLRSILKFTLKFTLKLLLHVSV